MGDQEALRRDITAEIAARTSDIRRALEDESRQRATEQAATSEKIVAQRVDEAWKAAGEAFKYAEALAADARGTFHLYAKLLVGIGVIVAACFYFLVGDTFRETQSAVREDVDRAARDEIRKFAAAQNLAGIVNDELSKQVRPAAASAASRAVGQALTEVDDLVAVRRSALLAEVEAELDDLRSFVLSKVEKEARAASDTSSASVLESLSAENLWPIGSVIAYAGSPTRLKQPPDAYWLPCDGRMVPRAEYPALLAILEDAGWQLDVEGDMFAVPDLQNQFLRGGSGERRNGDSQDWLTALPREAFAVSSSGVHSHAVEATGLGTDDLSFSGDGLARFDKPSSSGHKVMSSKDGGHSHVISGGGDVETRPMNVSVTWLIRAK